MMGVNNKPDEDSLEGLAEINVTPLVDVFLVLLVIFMITAPVIKTALEMGLPEAESANPNPAQGLTVKVFADSTMFIVTETYEERVYIGAFGNRFKAIWNDLEEEGKRRPVFLAADETIPYSVIIYALDVMRTSGVKDIGLLTQRVEEAKRRGDRR